MHTFFPGEKKKFSFLMYDIHDKSLRMGQPKYYIDIKYLKNKIWNVNNSSELKIIQFGYFSHFDVCLPYK